MNIDDLDGGINTGRVILGGIVAGLVINAGHGLHYTNVQEIARIPQIVELNIGHAIVAQAVFDGLPRAVADMKYLMLGARQS